MNGPPPQSDRRRPRALLGPLLRNLRRHPFRTFIVDDQRGWRGIHLYLGALYLARAIERASPNRRIGLMLPTSGMFPLAAMATWLLGRTAVPLNYLLRPQELAYVIGDAELDLVVTVRPMIERFGELPEGVRPLFLEDLERGGIPPFRRAPAEDPARTAVLIYTSGTSGRPKGVELSVAALAANVSQCAEWGAVTERDVFLGVLPQFHCFGLTVLTLLPLTAGGKVVYTARFVPRRLFELMRRHRPTGFVGIPAMYNALLSDRKATSADFTSYRYLISGGEPLSSRVRERFEERFGITISQGYGLTETSAVLNWCRPEDGKPESVGKPLPGVEEVVTDIRGNPLPPGEEGEIRVRGPNLMTRYFKLPELTARAFDANGYFKTGDLGRIDESGHLFITGRISDLIIIAGENVFPTEIEEVLNTHPSVADSAVIGVPDPARGQVPVAFIELAEGATFDETALRAHCREHLATYKVPRSVQVIDELPRTPTGKVLRRALPVPAVR